MLTAKRPKAKKEPIDPYNDDMIYVTGNLLCKHFHGLEWLGCSEWFGHFVFRKRIPFAFNESVPQFVKM